MNQALYAHMNNKRKIKKKVDSLKKKKKKKTKALETMLILKQVYHGC
jgi:hypothetical protein